MGGLFSMFSGVPTGVSPAQLGNYESKYPWWSTHITGPYQGALYDYVILCANGVG